MGFDEFPKRLSVEQRRKRDRFRAGREVADDVYDFRHFAESCLKSAPGFLARSDLYASLCDLAANHPVYLTDLEDAQSAMDQWNDIAIVQHDALPALEAAILAASQS